MQPVHSAGSGFRDPAKARERTRAVPGGQPAGHFLHRTLIGRISSRPVRGADELATPNHLIPDPQKEWASRRDAEARRDNNGRKDQQRPPILFFSFLC
ncbi:MAG TPA: hypothetical protein VLK84_23545, partial [Longimicrobium sp.]|nr:hypothetical protein [Longimicrobium sp.]